MSQDRCLACHQYFIEYKKEREIEARPPQNMCANCGAGRAVSNGRCGVCAAYRMSHGDDIDSKKARQMHRDGTHLCIVCGMEPAAKDDKCVTCIRYSPKNYLNGAKTRQTRGRPGAACVICGRPNIVAKSRCPSCYQHLNKHGSDRDPDRARKLAMEAGAIPKSCTVCGKPQVISRDRCSSCYQYYNKHGQDRDPDRARKLAARAAGPEARCVTCGKSQVVSRDRCSSCYQYFTKHGTDRDPERVRELLERAMRPKNAPCSNCHRFPAASRGRCATCYRYYMLHGTDRDPDRPTRRQQADGRRPKENCINGCPLEPRTWADDLWVRPYYGDKPNIITITGGREQPADSGWLCATHYARWRKYPCTKQPPPSGSKNKIRAYANGMWVCKGRTLSDSAYCHNVPLKLDRIEGTGELDYGKTQVDDLDVFLDGLCQDCRIAEQGIVYDKAIELAKNPHPSPKVMKRALGIVMRKAKLELARAAKGPGDAQAGPGIEAPQAAM